MANPWETDDCAHLRSQCAVYSIPEAAARWCGVPENCIEAIVDEATRLSGTGFGRGVWQHPRVPCMEVHSRLMAEAIETGELPCGREDGRTVTDGSPVAAERRTVLGRDLRAWMIKALPNQKPPFLFDDIEQNSHTSISTDAYRALIADRDDYAKRADKAIEESRQLLKDKELLEHKCDTLLKKIEAMGAPGNRAGTTYLNIIAALLDAINGNLPGTERHPSFANDSELIDAIVKHFSGFSGLSRSNLSRKFPEAKRHLQAQ